MPWDEDHKRATRARIVKTAAAAFRADGLAKTSVAEVMKRAGLTHGGFYAHFGSKDELVAEVVHTAGVQTQEWLSDAVDKRGDAPPLRAVVEAYLSKTHFEHPERGCPLVTSAVELQRGGEVQAAACRQIMLSYIEWLQQYVEAPSDDTRASRSIGILAAMVGGMTLARGMAKKSDAERILKNVREFIDDATQRPSKTTTR